MSAVIAVDARTQDRYFYLGMSLASAAIVFAGFAPTFFLRPAAQPALSPLLVVHGVVFTAWIALFVSQALLVAANRRDLHRRLGWAGAALAAAVVILGTGAAVEALRLGRAPIPGLDPRSFFVIPMRAILNFAILAAAAIALRRDAASHKRLIILATIAILDAAIARLPGVGAYGPPLFFVLQDLLVAVACVYDRRVHGRVHAAYKWGGALIVLTQPLSLAVAGTAPWLALANWARG